MSDEAPKPADPAEKLDWQTIAKWVASGGTAVILVGMEYTGHVPAGWWASNVGLPILIAFGLHTAITKLTGAGS